MQKILAANPRLNNKGQIYIPDIFKLSSLLRWIICVEQPAQADYSATLDCSNLPNLTALPEGLSIEGDLHLVGCSSLTALPDRLSARNIDCSGCTHLTALPEDFKVNKLNLTDCSNLTAVPERLSVKFLDCSGCTGLTVLPEDLNISRLNLSGCSNLTALPDSLGVRDLDCTGCTRLTTVPSSIIVNGGADHNHLRSINLTATGVSEAEFERLVSIARNVRLEFGVTTVDHPFFPTIADAINSWVTPNTARALRPES